VPSRMVSVSASVNLHLHHKVQKFSSGTGLPGWSRKMGRKTLVCSRKAITRFPTSPNVDISQNSNNHILVVCDATVTWLGMLVVLHLLCMLM